MNFLKKIRAWEKLQLQKPETHLVLGIVGGILIGIGADNLGLGIALGISFGIPAYASCKKKEDSNKADKNT